jgi:short chain dehydrogenase
VLHERNPVAVVTGAAKGIGRAICQAVADAGWVVAAVDIEPPTGHERRDGIRHWTADIADIASHEALLDDIVDTVVGMPDCLVNNAGAMGGGTDVALETADAALLKNRVTGVAELIALSQTTLANIWQNIAMALGLKAVFLVTHAPGHNHTVDGDPYRYRRHGAGDAERPQTAVLALRMTRQQDLHRRVASAILRMVLALAATLGALFIGGSWDRPYLLCWYQRVLTGCDRPMAAAG